MLIALATITNIQQVVALFKENLDYKSNGIYSEEFLCPLGIKAAIRRKQMIVAINNGKVIGALRFYRKKTSKEISLYQFAISGNFRGQGLLKKMLITINDLPIFALCPIESEFNEYYYKSGWHLQNQGEKYKVWAFIG